MKVEISKKKDNPLLSRQEVKGALVFDKATPSNDELAAVLAKQLNVSVDCIRVKKIETHYGASRADFLAFVYSSADELERIERAPKKWIEKQEKIEQARKKAKQEEAAKAEAKPEEKPAEEKKSAPEEEKKEAKPEESSKQEKKEGAE